MFTKKDKAAIIFECRLVPLFFLFSFATSLLLLIYAMKLNFWMNGVVGGETIPFTTFGLIIFFIVMRFWNPLAQFAGEQAFWRVPFLAFDEYPSCAFAFPCTAIMAFLLSFVFCPGMSNNTYIVDGEVVEKEGFFANPITSDISSTWNADNGAIWKVEAVTSDQFPVCVSLFMAFKNGEKGALETAHASFRRSGSNYFHDWMRSEAVDRVIQPKIRSIIEKTTLRELFPSNWIVAEAYKDITNKQLAEFGLAWKAPPNILSIDPTLNDQN